jgi:hypothetical protein
VAFVRWLKEAADETAKLGIIIDRALMRHGDYFDFGGHVCRGDRQGVSACEEGAWSLRRDIG